MASVCLDCGGFSRQHLESWSEGLIAPVIGFLSYFMPKRLEDILGSWVDRAFIALGVFKRGPLLQEHVPMRAWVFAEAARRRNIDLTALGSVAAYTNRFEMTVNGRRYIFESLPMADFLSRRSPSLMDDKASVKSELRHRGFPVLEGRPFWFWESSRAFAYAARLGFPLVVKPRFGSYSRHVFTNIQDERSLRSAVREVLRYGPAFLIERYFGEGLVTRLSVVDFQLCGALTRLHPHVTGDGVRTVDGLIQQKNSDPRRGPPDREEYVLFQIADDERIDRCLLERGITRKTIPQNGETVRLHRDPFIRLGADSEEVLDVVDPGTVSLARQIARIFDTRLVGIDVMAEDITKPWHDQRFAILELNSAPCIEVHHEPTYGAPSDVAGAVADMVLKYY